MDAVEAGLTPGCADWQSARRLLTCPTMLPSQDRLENCRGMRRIQGLVVQTNTNKLILFNLRSSVFIRGGVLAYLSKA
jgi:hypothetical protein